AGNGAAVVIDLSDQRIRSIICRADTDCGVPADRPAIIVIKKEVRIALRGEIAGESEVEGGVSADVATAVVQHETGQGIGGDILRPHVDRGVPANCSTATSVVVLH